MLKGKTGGSERVEDLGHGVDVGGSSEIQTQVKLDGGLHDVLGRPLHGVVQAGVHDVLLRGSGHLVEELITRLDGDGAAHTPEPGLQGLLD